MATKKKLSNKLRVFVGTSDQIESIENELQDGDMIFTTDEVPIPQSDWGQENSGELDFIKNKPIIVKENIKVTYSDLVNLITNSALVAGQKYQIIDYETTTTQHDSKSAGNFFDIVVEALSGSVLSENASATFSARDIDGYFAQSKPNSWQIKYTVENNKNKHYWADEVNGKGVIYQMIDEFGNDLPYDFKNIQFKRYLIETYTINTDLENRYYALKDLGSNTVPSGTTIDDNDFIWAYTFTVIDENGIVNDVSLNKNKTFVSDEGVYYHTKNNKIGSFYYYYYDEIEETSKRKEALGNNVMLYDYDYFGYWEFYGFNYNTIGNDFNYNTIGNDFNYNTIGNDFNSNTIGNYFKYNTIGNSLNSNTIGNSFNYNTIGNYFNSNTIGNSFNYNTIGNSFNSNTIGNSFNYNTIGNDFNYNTIGNDFNSNTIGNYFKYNTIGMEFQRNWVGNNFYFNQINDEFYDDVIENRVQYITINSIDVRNITIKNGVRGNSNANRLVLDFAEMAGYDYNITYKMASNDNIVAEWNKTFNTIGGKYKANNTSLTWIDF